MPFPPVLVLPLRAVVSWWRKEVNYVDHASILNAFKNVSTPHLSDEQRSEIAKLLAEYLRSYDFERFIKELPDR